VSIVDHTPKALFAIGALGAGGSETQITEILTRLREHGIEPALVTATGESAGDRRERLDRAGVRVLTIGPIDAHRLLQPIISFRRYAGVLRAVRPDVIYAWLEESSLYLVPLARMFGIPVVIARRNVIGAAVEARRPLARVVIRRVESLAQIVTCNSRAVMQEAVRRGIDARRLRLVPNGHPACPALPPRSDNGEVVIGYLARFRPEKGHSRLVRVLSRMDRELDWRVRLGGDGALEAATRTDIHVADLHERVEFLGEVRDPRAFWREADIAVLLSDSEGSPNVLIEAAFAGRPLVATNVDGSAEVVHVGTGVLVDPDDDEGAARALERLVADAELRRALGAAAHAMATAEFGIERAVHGHVAALREALDGRA
jgi:glycosyltransferase involved in cell wall biosynthesis